MKVAIVDLETTGTDPLKHEIIDLGAVIFDSGKPDVIEVIDCKIRPTHIETADPAALKVNGYNPAEWHDAVDLYDALLMLQKKADGAVFMAYNVTFDWAFIAHAYKNSPLRNPFNYHKICLMTFAWSRMPTAGVLKLKEICNKLEIAPEPEVHKALNGAKRAHEVYRRLSIL